MKETPFSHSELVVYDTLTLIVLLSLGYIYLVYKTLVVNILSLLVVNCATALYLHVECPRKNSLLSRPGPTEYLNKPWWFAMFFPRVLEPIWNDFVHDMPTLFLVVLLIPFSICVILPFFIYEIAILGIVFASIENLLIIPRLLSFAYTKIK